MVLVGEWACQLDTVCVFVLACVHACLCMCMYVHACARVCMYAVLKGESLEVCQPQQGPCAGYQSSTVTSSHII